LFGDVAPLDALNSLQRLCPSFCAKSLNTALRTDLQGGECPLEMPAEIKTALAPLGKACQNLFGHLNAIWIF